MSVYCVVNQTMSLDDPTKKIQLREPLAYTNSRAHAFRVTVIDEDGEAADLTGMSCTGQFVRLGNNTTVFPILGSVTGNVCEVILPISCYLVPGRARFTMDIAKKADATGVAAFSASTAYAVGDKVVHDGSVYQFYKVHAAGAWTGTDAALMDEIRTALWVECIVERNTSESIVDPGTPVGNIDTVINQCTAAASSANSAATAANTAAAAAQAIVDDWSIATVAETEEYLDI